VKFGVGIVTRLINKQCFSTESPSVSAAFLPPANKALYSLLAKVLWGFSDPRLRLLSDLVAIPKLSSTNGVVRWPKQMEVRCGGWGSSPAQLCVGCCCPQTGVRSCVVVQEEDILHLSLRSNSLRAPLESLHGSHLHLRICSSFFRNVNQNHPFHVPEGSCQHFPCRGRCLELLLGWRSRVMPVRGLPFHFCPKVANPLWREAVQTSATLVNSYQSPRRYNLEDSLLGESMSCPQSQFVKEVIHIRPMWSQQRNASVFALGFEFWCQLPWNKPWTHFWVSQLQSYRLHTSFTDTELQW
jgi:hypothetical protein